MNPATTKRNKMFGPTMFVRVPTNDFAKIGLGSETTMVFRLMNLFGTLGHADRFDP